MKTSTTMHLIRTLNGKFLKERLRSIEKRFNSLPGRTRNIVAIATGLFVAMTCTQIIIGAILFNTSSLDLPASIASPKLQGRTTDTLHSEKMVPIGRMQNLNDASLFQIVAINSYGEYFISTQQTTSEEQPIMWTPMTTESLQLIEQRSRFIPASKDSSIHP